ncbi:hypothetical protein KKHLCK_02120 [Candidatus Electrothrix laxa]
MIFFRTKVVRNRKWILSSLLLSIILCSMSLKCYASSGDVTVYNESKAYNGYTIYYATEDEAIKIIDMWGNEVRTIKIPDGGNPKPILSNGNILMLLGSRMGGLSLVELDKDRNFVYQYYDKEYSSLHHDQEKTADGNYFVLGSIFHEVFSVKQGTLRDDFILEIDPSGNVVWEWLTSDHFASFDFSDEALEIILDGGLYDDAGEDIFHSNSIQVLPENKNYDQGDDRFKPGNILVSQRNTNIVFIIDKNSGKIVWKIGPDDNMTIGQHNANMIPKGYSGAGNILIFDNGGAAGYPLQSRNWSRIIEVNSAKEVVWQYTATDFFSDFMGGTQRLPNGNTLICEAGTGRIFEVTGAGEKVWEYHRYNTTYRAYRVGPEFMIQ